MAKNTGPLFSNEASGSLGDFLTFSKRKTGQQVRFQRKQKIVIPSWGQADQQSMYRVAFARWLSLSAAQRLAYDDEVKAKNLRMSGWNLFFQKAVADPLTYLGLAGYWSMNRTKFGTILDLSKNGNVGTLKPIWPGNSPQYVDSKNKKMLNALSFDGVDDYVNISNSPSLQISDAITIGLWVKVITFAVTPTVDHIICKPINSHYDIYVSEPILGNRGATAILKDSGGATHWIDIIPVGSFLVDTWYYLAVTYDGTTARTYKNGVYSGYSAIFDGLALNSNNLSFPSSGHHILDGVHINNRALLSAELLSLYNLFE